MANSIGQRLDITEADKRRREKMLQGRRELRGAPVSKPGTGGVAWKPGMGMKIDAPGVPARQRRDRRVKQARPVQPGRPEKPKRGDKKRITPVPGLVSGGPKPRLIGYGSKKFPGVM